MNMISRILIFFFLSVGILSAAESGPVSKPGLSRLQLVTDASSVHPGESFTVGLLLHHEPGYHTYWKGPGIVGISTFLKWDLPEGFSAGEIQWPAPQTTIMASLIAYGYETDTCLLTEITVPEKIETDDITIAVRCGWMACAKSCHPGWHDFSLTIPVNRTGKPEAPNPKWRKVFQTNRKRFPKSPPKDWSFTAAELAGDRITLEIDTAGTMITNADAIYFFSYDNQVDSDKPQKISVSSDEKKIKFELARPEFAPEKVTSLTGVIFHPDGWPGLGTKWLTLDAPWPKKTR